MGTCLRAVTVVCLALATCLGSVSCFQDNKRHGDVAQKYTYNPGQLSRINDERQRGIVTQILNSGTNEAASSVVRPPDLNEGNEVQSVSVTAVLVLTLIMSVMTGLGVTPFFFFGQLDQAWAGICNSIACGVMLAASFDLIHEGELYGPALVVFGTCLGAIFIRVVQKRIEKYEDLKFQSLRGADARRLVLFCSVMAAHALGEGIGVGVSFCGKRGWAQGLLVTIAIGVHNIPEGLAVGTVMVGNGVDAWTALGMAVLTALPQFFLAVPSFLFVNSFQALLPLSLGFAAGCMVWIVFSELLPEAVETCPKAYVATAGTCSAAFLEGTRMLLDSWQQPDGQLASPLLADGALAVPATTTLGLTALPVVLASLATAAVARRAAFGKGSLGFACGAAVGAKLGIGAMGFVWLARLRIIPLHVAAVLFIAGGCVVVAVWKLVMQELDLGDGKSEADVGSPKPRLLPTHFVPQVPLSQVICAAATNAGDSPRGVQYRPAAHVGAAQLEARASDLLPEDASPSKRRQLLRLMSGGFMWVGPTRALELHLASVLGVGVLAFHELVRGWLLTQAAIDEPAHVALKLLLPASLQGLPVGILAGGLGLLLYGKQQTRARRWLAVGLAFTAPAVAALSYVQLPVSLGATNLLQRFDPNAVNAKLYAVASGAMAVSAVWALSPAVARQPNPELVTRGITSGVVTTVVLYCVLGLLCRVTPFCPGEHNTPMIAWE